MARTRTVSPEFFTNPELPRAEARTGLPLRVIYAGLWCQADREGRFRWDPTRLKLAIAPYDDLDMAAALAALIESGHVVRYEVDGELLGWIPTLKRHQSFHPREAASRLPAPPGQLQVPPPQSGTPKADQGLPKANQAAEKVDTGSPLVAEGGLGKEKSTGLSGPSVVSGPSVQQNAHRARGEWNEARLREHLPASCHADLRDILLHSRTGAPGVARAIAAMCGLDPNGIPASAGMRTCSVEEMAAVIGRVATAKDPSWHQGFANRALDSVRREAKRVTVGVTAMPTSVPRLRVVGDDDV